MHLESPNSGYKQAMSSIFINNMSNSQNFSNFLSQFNVASLEVDNSERIESYGEYFKTSFQQVTDSITANAYDINMGIREVKKQRFNSNFISFYLIDLMMSPDTFDFFRRIEDSLNYTNEDGANKAKSERKPGDFQFYYLNSDHDEPLEEARYTLTGKTSHSH
jgi:hypothetical protein